MTEVVADWNDYIRGGIFLVAFCILGLWKLPHWLMAETIMMVFTGVGLYSRPDITITLQTKDMKIDAVHLQLNRLFASCLLGYAVIWFTSRRSEDSNVIAALLWTRVVGLLCVISVIGTGHFHYRKIFTQKHIWFGILGNFLWWLANVVQLLKNRPSVKGNCQTRGITLVSHINLVVMLLVALTLLAFPASVTEIEGHRLNGFHLHTSRVTGALLIGFVILSWFLPRFHSIKDIRMVYIGQLLVVILIATSVGVLKFNMEKIRQKEMAALCGLYAPVFAVSLCGVITTLGTHQQISTADSKKQN